MRRLQRRRQARKKDCPTIPLPDSSSGMFEKQSDSGYRLALNGIDRKTLVHGEKTLMTEFRMRKGAALPSHSHPHEQTGYLVKGRIRLSIGTEEYNAQVGDSWCVPGGVEHSADILEDSVAIEVFSPVRDDYVPGRA
jgi:quercetin dioxygenase-like cupin family protein